MLAKYLGIGLSPRGRGNPIANIGNFFTLRSIPAWAGEPPTTALPRSPWAVYPRVGGGTHASAGAARRRRGLSPRGRGNRAESPDLDYESGSIPAWAGEPTTTSLPARFVAVYPRVGGGTALCGVARTGTPGLSPRGRGNPSGQRQELAGGGSIPAWAGEPSFPRLAGFPLTVYPRVGGGTVWEEIQDIIGNGLSPRGRGNRRRRVHGQQVVRSIPAWAGEPISESRLTSLTWVYPRVGGGTLRTGLQLGGAQGLSPRGRGNRP